MFGSVDTLYSKIRLQRNDLNKVVSFRVRLGLGF